MIVDEWTKYIHKKTEKVYDVCRCSVINATNGSADGQRMVIYRRDGKVFVREMNEFFDKFEKLE